MGQTKYQFNITNLHVKVNGEPFTGKANITIYHKDYPDITITAENVNFDGAGDSEAIMVVLDLKVTNASTNAEKIGIKIEILNY